MVFIMDGYNLPRMLIHRDIEQLIFFKEHKTF